MSETKSVETSPATIRSVVKRFVMRNILLAMAFHRDIKAGQTYIFRDHACDPFKRDKLIVEVIAVSGKWVNYKHIGSSIWKDESIKRNSFNFCFVRSDA